ncbi:MAG: hypothetical protein JSS14_18570 [Proteobacteria bacterium]|nr:hypothetical protein [Pseudomonadota bacterium]
MTIKYSNLGADRQLNEIVMAGSHDAAITSGPTNAQTQSLDILGQAQAGVRFFDIRVAAQTVPGGGPGGKEAQLRAFHAPGLNNDTKTRQLKDLGGQSVAIERSKLKGEGMGAAWGMGLTQILQDAKKFVESAEFSGEFLILKFDKCTNWGLIADTCRSVLGNKIYSGGGNLNTKSLADLAGKVVVGFMSGGYSELKLPAQRVGITHIKNLYKPPAGYDGNFDGLQYWGAGGTKLNNSGHDAKIEENIRTQKGILKKAAVGIADKKVPLRNKVKTPGCSAADPNAVGMMYWTTTGVFKNIKERNDKMWDKQHLGGMDTIWRSGFKDYIDNALPGNVDACSFSSGGMLKLFMPNIVMIDFADPEKCDHIYGLNVVAAAELVKICQKLDLVGAAR